MSPESFKKYSRIYLVSSDNYLAGALSYVFEREISSKCVILKDGEAAPPDDLTQGIDKVLYLIDCQERDFQKELVAIAAKEDVRGSNLSIALFNLQKGSKIERKAFNRGIRGFFYRDDSLMQTLKGVKSLLNGEIWMARDILVEVALQGRVKARASHDKSALSHREAEILALLSVGSSNDEIAEKLFISPNTVKTHLYRVFRKIKVPNRFQAALWAAKNL